MNTRRRCVSHSLLVLGSLALLANPLIEAAVGSCVSAECIQLACIAAGEMCTELNKSSADLFYGNIGGGVVTPYNPPQTYQTRTRGTCTSTCDPPMGGDLATCGGAYISAFAGTNPRKYCNSNGTGP